MVVLLILLTFTSGCGPKVDYVVWNAEPVVELPWTFSWKAEMGRGRLLWLATAKAVEEGRTELALSSVDRETGETVRRYTFETKLWKQDLCGSASPLLDGESCVWVIPGIVQDDEAVADPAGNSIAGPAGNPTTADPVPASIYGNEYATIVVVVTPIRAEPLMLRFPYRVWYAGEMDGCLVLESRMESSPGEDSVEDPRFAWTLVDIATGAIRKAVEIRGPASFRGFAAFKGRSCMALIDELRLMLYSVDSGQEVARFNLGDTRVDPKTGEAAAGLPVEVVLSKNGEYFVVRYFSKSSGGAIAKVLMDGSVEWVRPGAGLQISDDGEWILTTTGTEVPFAEVWTVQAFDKAGDLLVKTSYTTSGHRWGAQHGIWEKGLWWIVPGNSETGWRVEWLDLAATRPTVNSATVPHETGRPQLSYDGKYIFDGNRIVYTVTSQPE